MTGEEMIFEMILAVNQPILDELKVVILFTDLEFTDPAARTAEDYNTAVGATAVRGMTEGTQTYHYTRPDIQEAFSALGYDEVSVRVDGAVNVVTVLSALKTKHNLQLQYNEVRNFQQVGEVVSFDIAANCYSFVGSLQVTVSEESPYLAAYFPNNVLTGLFVGNELSANAPTTELAGFDAAG